MATKKKQKQKQDDRTLAQDIWRRYQHGRVRGHDQYVREAKRLEDFYLGGGRQWSEKDRQAVEASGRPCVEINKIFPAVNTAIGEQLGAKVDIAFRPRNIETSDELATTLTKLAKYTQDEIKLQWLESQMFADGMIQRRGFIEMYMDFTENAFGVLAARDLDPLDVVIDPNANGYDPSTWGEVMILRWYTLDEIRMYFGEKKADEVEQAGEPEDSEDEAEERNSFGENKDEYLSSSGSTWKEGGVTRYMAIDRQYVKLERCDVLINPKTGQIEVAERYTPTERERMLAQGFIAASRMMKRIRWSVSTRAVMLHDEWSPYRTLSILPFFPYFRRGKSAGMVDNAVSPQEVLNKSKSQALHIVNTTANSGWMLEDGSLVNMSPEDLESQGAKTGLVVTYKKGSQKPEKIQPNSVPQGVTNIANEADLAIKEITGMSDAQQGLQGNEVSGVAIQSKQWQGKTQLGGVIHNLARTRNLIAQKMLELFQDFYTEERVFMIANNADPGGKVTYEPLEINKRMPDGVVANNISVGEYQIIIGEKPVATTFEDTEFNHAMEMRREGVPIPDSFIIETSSLAKKREVIEALNNQAEATDPLNDAKVRQIDAQAEKTRADAVAKSVEAQYSAMQSAMVIAGMPQVVPVADALLLSAGFQDKDQAPIVPQIAGDMGGQMIDAPQNTNPLTPANPGVGINQGIRTPENDGGGINGY
ncbi:portal protein [Chrysiogenes arsenatis]|uniref:portal protein n=1 Tax=Chrysiogenes arsenatis TaxID=309797 RepID=UPI00042A6FCF|nr:hypothetical protein [Chrysiogenes arsenatis]